MKKILLLLAFMMMSLVFIDTANAALWDKGGTLPRESKNTYTYILAPERLTHDAPALGLKENDHIIKCRIWSTFQGLNFPDWPVNPVVIVYLQKKFTNTEGIVSWGTVDTQSHANGMNATELGLCRDCTNAPSYKLDKKADYRLKLENATNHDFFVGIMMGRKYPPKVYQGRV